MQAPVGNGVSHAAPVLDTGLDRAGDLALAPGRNGYGGQVIEQLPREGVEHDGRVDTTRRGRFFFDSGDAVAFDVNVG